jgi:hypothetical protein
VKTNSHGFSKSKRRTLFTLQLLNSTVNTFPALSDWGKISTAEDFNRANFDYYSYLYSLFAMREGINKILYWLFHKLWLIL